MLEEPRCELDKYCALSADVKREDKIHPSSFNLVNVQWSLSIHGRLVSGPLPSPQIPKLQNAQVPSVRWTVPSVKQYSLPSTSGDAELSDTEGQLCIEVS